ncbi:MAG: hypothetical protein ACM3ZV_08930 [Bacillota bacterium]
MKLSAAAIAISWSGVSSAASIMVSSTSDDAVGQSLIYYLKDDISRSSMHRLVYTEDDAAFVIRIVTLKENEGRSAAYAAVLTMPQIDKKGFNYYVSSQVGYCGADVTERCASDILAAFDQPISEVVSALTDAFKKKPR